MRRLNIWDLMFVDCLILSLEAAVSKDWLTLIMIILISLNFNKDHLTVKI